ncbi:MAG: M28 family peptidase [Flavobacteriales bacterium]|nr:M28 family peptidase [Flavobacteriales bacterium]
MFLRCILRIVLICALLSTTVAHAQPRAEVLANARHVVDTLTDPIFHGRGYVKNGDHLASTWIAEEYARIGLGKFDQGYRQPFEFNVNSFPDTVNVRVDGVRLVPGVDFILDPASGKATGNFDLVHFTLEELNDVAQSERLLAAITDRAVCLHFPTTKNADTLRIRSEWKAELMQVCPVIVPVEGKLTWSVAQEERAFPLIEVKATKVSRSTKSIDLAIKNQFLRAHKAENVLGTIKGQSDEWIIVSAHYDHLGEMGPDALFPGANDNASGIAMLLGLAEWFRSNPPKHNLLFIAFAGEEAGLMGSQYCVSDPWFDLTKVKLMVNLDILGTGDDGIMVVNATAQKKHYANLVRINKKRKLLPLVKARGPSCNSDHCPFVQRGVPAVFLYTMGGITAYHDVFDRPETLPLTKFPEVYALLKEFITRTK